MKKIFNLVRKIFNRDICLCGMCMKEFENKKDYEIHYPIHFKDKKSNNMVQEKNGKWIPATPLPFYGTKYDWDNYK